MNIPANRVVLILHSAVTVLTLLGIFIATITHSLPAKWQTTLLAVGGIVGALAAGTVAVVKFLDGSQKFDALQAGTVIPADSPMLAALENPNPAPQPAPAPAPAPPPAVLPPPVQ